MFYKCIAITMTDIGPQRVTPLGALLFKISLVYFTLWTSKFGHVLSSHLSTILIHIHVPTYKTYH